MCANFHSKWTTLTFSTQICSKKDLGFETEKCRNKNQHRRDILCAKFEPNWTALSFSVQICPKMDLGLEIHKTNVGTRISQLQITRVPIFKQNEQFWLFWHPNFPKNGYRVGNPENVGWNKNQHRQDAMRTNIQEKCTTLTLSARKNQIEFQKSKSRFGICTSKIPCVPIFRQNGQLWIFGPRFAQFDFWGRNF